MRSIVHRLASTAITLLAAAGLARADGYVQTNLVADQAGMAQQTDPNLINPWGISFSTTSPMWVSNQGGTGPAGIGTSTVYGIPSAGGGLSSSSTLLTVQIPNAGGAAPSDGNGPTGQVSTGAAGITTSASDFQVGTGTAAGKANFIFANLDGTISAWRGALGGSAAITVPTAGASYTGLAIGMSGGHAFIFAADQNSQNVDIFDAGWNKVGTLTDPNLPAGKGFTAFNVQNLNGTLFVTYAIPGTANGGVVDEFATDGTFIKRLITDADGLHSQTPWGLAQAPTGWGALGGDLLVGNNDGDGTINAYGLDGSWKGQLMLSNGTVFSKEELWALTFGNGANAGSPNVLYFAAGLTDAQHGLLGALSVPEPGSAVLGLIALGTLGAGWGWKHRRRAATS